ncbi:unnamed protein product [Ceratitis capitata]|uniref:(Mediterranean fruit fly) hypothetical protein n=1 Tax=Ceratitis capitata TaxID=7213 RepID=A0A811V9G6_CERCA|nr:unnamed protein product [Ceratitis capitata]
MRATLRAVQEMLLIFKLRALLLSYACLNSLLQPVQLWSVEYNLNLLCKMGKMVRTQELIWYVSERLDTADSAGIEEFIRALHDCLGITQTVLSNRTDWRFIQTENRKNSLSVIFCTAPDDPIIYVYDRTQLGRHFYFGWLIYMNTVSDFVVVDQLLSALSEHSFHNTMLYYYSTNETNEVFASTLFPEYHHVNRSDFLVYLATMFGKLVAGGMDLQGYKFYTPLQQDLPHVFSYMQRDSPISWRGSAYNLLKLFLNYGNATLARYEMPKDRLGGDVIDMKAALELIRRKKIAVMAHAYALFKEDDEQSKSYPLMVVRWCLMVPIWNSVTTMFYPLKPFDDFIWFCMLCVFVALVFIRCLWCCWQGTHQLAARLSDNILQSFCLSIGMATSHFLGAPSVFDFLIFTTIFFYGFFLTANYTSLLGSIFTVTLFHAQINTMQDLIETNISVMIIDYELEFLRSTGDDLPVNFTRLILPVDAATFTQHQVQFNSSFAYFVTEEKWRFLDLQQKYLKQRLFKFTDICFGSYHLAYPLQPDSFLYRNLEYYIYRMHSSGMLSHYESTAFDYAVSAGLMKRLADSSEYTSAGMQHLFVVFLMLLVMCGLGVVVFMGELMKYKSSRHRTVSARM